MEIMLLLLSLLIMPKEEPKVIDYQNVDYVQPVLQYDPGIAKPSIDSKVQTNNRFLDTAVFTSNLTIPGETLYDVPDYTTSILSGKLNWKVSSGKIIIPETGTYIVQGGLFISQYLGTDPITIYVDGITSYNNVEATHGTTIPILFIYNFNRGDDIYISIDNSDVADIEAVITLNIIKLS